MPFRNNVIKGGFILKIGRVFVFVILILISLNSVIAYDLSEYPSPFIKDGKFDGFLVVGDKAPASDITALTNIVRSLLYPILGSDPETISLR